jgi:hypothetical protein
MRSEKLKSEVIDLIQNLPPHLLTELLEFVRQLQVCQRLEKAEKDFDEGKAVNWRVVRSDV